MTNSLTVQEIFEEMPDHFLPQAAAGLDVVYQFEITGEQASTWHVIIKDQNCEAIEGAHPSPKVIYTMEDVVFIDIITGTMSGQTALFTGKLKLKGDFMLAQKMESLFKR